MPRGEWSATGKFFNLFGLQFLTYGTRMIMLSPFWVLVWERTAFSVSFWSYGLPFVSSLSQRVCFRSSSEPPFLHTWNLSPLYCLQIRVSKLCSQTLLFSLFSSLTSSITELGTKVYWLDVCTGSLHFCVCTFFLMGAVSSFMQMAVMLHGFHVIEDTALNTV